MSLVCILALAAIWTKRPKLDDIRAVVGNVVKLTSKAVAIYRNGFSIKRFFPATAAFDWLTQNGFS